MMQPENISRLAEYRPDYLGFIFYKFSKRFAGEINEKIIQNLPIEIKRTGVFVDSELSEIIDKIELYKLTAVQLHGNESAEVCQRLKQEGVEVIKAFGVDEDFDFKVLVPYNDAVDYFLFDTKTVQHGGSGEVFDWSILNKYPLDKPYFLSGGLSLENLNQVNAIEDSRLYAVDLNSRFEIEPGLKDIEKISKAINMIR
jgi:phosphoribosylanthranilate isomerase